MTIFWDIIYDTDISWATLKISINWWDIILTQELTSHRYWTNDAFELDKRINLNKFDGNIGYEIVLGNYKYTDIPVINSWDYWCAAEILFQTNKLCKYDLDLKNATKTFTGTITPPSSWGGWGWGGWWGWWGGWWGWWAWGPPLTCVTTDLQCSEYNGNYIWQRKSWISCDGGDLWKTCSVSQNTQSSSESISVSDPTPEVIRQELNTESQKNKHTENLKNKIQDTRVHVVMDSFSQIITQNWFNSFKIEYIAIINSSVRDSYQEFLKNYENLFISIDNFSSTQDEEYRKIALDNFRLLTKELNNLINVHLEYINIWDNWIYTPVDNNLKRLTDRLESMILKNKNWNTELKENFNSFILTITLYRESSEEYLRQEAIWYIANILEILR